MKIFPKYGNASDQARVLTPMNKLFLFWSELIFQIFCFSTTITSVIFVKLWNHFDIPDDISCDISSDKPMWYIFWIPRINEFFSVIFHICVNFKSFTSIRGRSWSTVLSPHSTGWNWARTYIDTQFAIFSQCHSHHSSLFTLQIQFNIHLLTMGHSECMR